MAVSDEIEKPRPVAFITSDIEQRAAEIAADLRSAPADAYDITLLAHLSNRLGMTPRAVLSKALRVLLEKESGSRAPTRRQLLGGKR